VALGPGGEFDLIRSVLGPETALPAGVVVGPGDDAAVLSGGRWALTCDLSVEDVHFRRDWLDPEEIGYRAAVVSLSDLAAMAAEPVTVLVACAATRADAASGVVERVHAGLREAVKEYGAAVVGGDVTRSPGPLVLDVTSVGRSESPILRDGARPGDEVWVTGSLGASAAHVRAMEAGGATTDAHRRAYARPSARTREALWLARTGELHALIDLSDGLVGDAGHLAAASGVALMLETASIPVAPGVAEVAGGGEEGVALALEGGEDYELVVVVPGGALDSRAADFRDRFGVTLSRVGRVETGDGVHIEEPDGTVRKLDRGGFDHFGPGARSR
jgi:thiamine-monophosphate kinase